MCVEENKYVIDEVLEKNVGGRYRNCIERWVACICVYLFIMW
jgi:hypothetical protein